MQEPPIFVLILFDSSMSSHLTSECLRFNKFSIFEKLYFDMYRSSNFYRAWWYLMTLGKIGYNVFPLYVGVCVVVHSFLSSILG